MWYFDYFIRNIVNVHLIVIIQKLYIVFVLNNLTSIFSVLINERMLEIQAAAVSHR